MHTKRLSFPFNLSDRAQSLQSAHFHFHHVRSCTLQVDDMASCVQPFRLLRLPVELRLHIYGYVFGEERPRYVDCCLTSEGAYFRRNYDSSEPAEDEPYPNVPLLQVCRQLHNEAVWFLGSRQTMRLHCNWWEGALPAFFALLPGFAIPPHCIGGKLDIVFFLPCASDNVPLQRAGIAPSMLRNFLIKANVRAITAVTIRSFSRSTTEDWSYELSRNLPSLGTTIHTSASSTVREWVDNNPDPEHRGSTSSLRATIDAIKKCLYADSF